MTDAIDSLGLLDAVVRRCRSSVERRSAASASTALAARATTTIANVVVLGIGAAAASPATCSPPSPARSCRCRWSSPRATSRPSFVDPSTLVIAISFSGDTEETVEAAMHRGGGRRQGPRRRAAAASSADVAEVVGLPTVLHPRGHPGRPGPRVGALADPAAHGARADRACSPAVGWIARPSSS